MTDAEIGTNVNRNKFHPVARAFGKAKRKQTKREVFIDVFFVQIKTLRLTSKKNKPNENHGRT